VKYQVNNHATVQGQAIGDHNKEASQSDQQQHCILSGGVYLLHRMKDNPLPFLLLKRSTTTRGVQDRRAGVQEDVRFLSKLSALSLEKDSPAS
jgi:hypothetical protein